MASPKVPYLSRPEQHIIDTKGQKIFNNALPDTWVIVPRAADDYGIDFQLEVFESFQPQMLRTAVQLKSTTRLRTTEDRISFSIDTRALATYVDREVLPVLVVLVDTEEKLGYFVHAQRFALEALKGKTWRDQQTVTLDFDPADRIDDTVRLLTALREAQKWNTSRQPAAIAGALRAEELRLESIDPRMRVRLTVGPEGERRTLSARESFTFSLGLAGAEKDKVDSFRAGERVKFEPGEVVVDGMPLWESLNESGGELKVGLDEPCSVTARSGANAELSNLPGTFTRGIEGFAFSASLAGNLFQARAVILSPARGEDATLRVSMSMSLEPWLTRDVCALPFLDELTELSEAILRGDGVSYLLHLPGRTVALPRFLPQQHAELQGMVKSLRLLAEARTVATVLSRPIILTRMPRAEDYAAVEKALALVTVGEYRAPGAKSSMTISCPRDGFKRDGLDALPGEVSLVLREGGEEMVDIFGERVACPLGEFIITMATGKTIERVGSKTVCLKLRGTKDSEVILLSPARIRSEAP